MQIKALLEPTSSKGVGKQQSIFRKEVCMRNCRLCSGQTPDFCMFFLANTGYLYFDNILYLITTARERRRMLYECLDTFEGFVALFCDARVCPLFSSRCNLRQKIDCYQMFLTQSGSSLEPDEEASIIKEYNEKTIDGICYELNEMYRIKESYSKNRKKKMRRMADTIITKLVRSSGTTIITTPVIKVNTNTNTKNKKVSTQLFYRDDAVFIQTINNILGI